MRSMRLACLLLGLVATWPAFAAARPAVTLEILPPQVVRRTFDPSRPPRDMPKLTPPEAGQCIYAFSCEMETRVERPARPGHPRRMRITGTTIRTRLEITLWTPAGGPAAIVAHEEGHREICEAYYRQAPAIARQLGREMVGSVLEPPPGGPAAADRALHAFQDRFIQRYLQQTLARCSHAQERFDVLTGHSRSAVPVAAAVAQALADEAAFHRSGAVARTPAPALSAPPAAAPARRSPPTRPRS